MNDKASKVLIVPFSFQGRQQRGWQKEILPGYICQQRDAQWVETFGGGVTDKICDEKRRQPPRRPRSRRPCPLRPSQERRDNRRPSGLPADLLHNHFLNNRDQWPSPLLVLRRYLDDPNDALC